MIEYRTLSRDDAEALRAIRLEAALHYGFTGMHAERALKPFSFWQDLAEETLTSATFGLFDHGELQGVESVRPWVENPTYPLWLGDFARQEYRGLGLMAPLYRMRHEWCLEHGYDTAMLYVDDGNERPMGIFARQGAVPMFDRVDTTLGPKPILRHWYRLDLRTQAQAVA